MSKSSHFSTLPQLVQFISRNYNNPEALGYKEHGSWKYLSTDEFVEAVQNVGLGLLECGVQPGDKVGLIANPSPFWIILDQSIVSIGAICVPLFGNISPDNLEYEIDEAEVRTMIVENKEQYDVGAQFKAKFNQIILMSDEQIEGTVNYQALVAMGKARKEKNSGEFETLTNKVKPDDLATIIYTSGSTGTPKGVEITHGNLVSQIEGAGIRFPLDAARDKAISALPLAHVFERMVTMYYLSSGITLCFAEEVKKIGDNLKEIHPTIVTLVPRLLEKVFAKMRSNVNEATGLKKILGGKAFERAVTKPYNAPSNLLDKLFDKLVYSKMRQGLGGNIRIAISGSAALSPDLCNFFLNIGLPIYEGYGCTETSPVISANFPGNRKIGTVGHAFPEVEVKISEEKEILARGKNVMLGYYKKEKETREVIDNDGWYHTGDLGNIDSEGYITITGRKKELFKTANGKYVAPIPIESAIVNQLSMIDMAQVVAENRKFTSCLLFPDFENLNKYKEKMQLNYMSHGEFLESPQVQEQIQAELDKINVKLNHWERVVKFIVAGNPLTIENGELTPTMKVRRHVVEEKFKEQIESLYRESGE